MHNSSISNEIEGRMKESKVLLNGYWSLAIGFFVFHSFCVPSLSLSPTFFNIYLATECELWAALVCWIFFACHRLKSGGFIRSFLSHPLWQPLSKLNYTTELTTFPFAFMWLMHTHVGDIFMSVAEATLAYVLIEEPAGRIVDLMWMLKRSPRKEGNVSRYTNC